MIFPGVRYNPKCRKSNQGRAKDFLPRNTRKALNNWRGQEAGGARPSLSRYTAYGFRLSVRIRTVYSSWVGRGAKNPPETYPQARGRARTSRARSPKQAMPRAERIADAGRHSPAQPQPTEARRGFRTGSKYPIRQQVIHGSCSGHDPDLQPVICDL